jgi:F-type H+-transporting ATPase subunit c
MNPATVSHLGQVSAAAGMGLSVVGLGIGVGLIFASFIQGIARQPELEGKLMVWTFIGFAIVEAMGIFSMLMCFLAIKG